MKSARMLYSAGTRIRVITVENKIPNPKDTAIGKIICACVDDSNIIGSRPKKVDNELSTIGLNLSAPASIEANG